jgi:long-chain acyl-CoA synthetase
MRVRPGDRIAFFMPNTGELVASYWACFAAGLVAVPLNHRYIAADPGRVLGHSRSTVLIAAPELADRLSPLDWKEVGVERRYLGGEGRGGWAPFDELLASEALEPVALDPSADAMIMYTSGTTGIPRTSSIRTKGCEPWPSRCEGGSATRRGDDRHRGVARPGSGVLPLIERWRVELLKVLPTALDDFVEADEHEHHDLSSLRVVAVADDKVPMDVHHRFFDLTGFEATEYIGMTVCSHYASNLRSARSASVRPAGRRQAPRCGWSTTTTPRWPRARQARSW